MSETTLLTTRQSRRSFGIGGMLLGVLLLGLPFLGRQRITLTNERIIVESGFWNKLRDDVEVFRIRDVVSARSLTQRLLGIGDVVVKAAEGRGPEEVMVLKGIPDPVGVSEAIRDAWNRSARPRGPAMSVD
ncbi:PH domain-containing protein [Siccirubricoccus sp. KC 17139]|uniref:PH domain-containing protein n=1 Tax=Siccirubricoccus soli TaxID=2899147 RepID=A0ABT1D4E4_9PROT|nr:PH domain-containing protein [Siccirubricoccus soli]MCO6416798.1 PH domain-containing protein [Siccirubricoccus soli]MCP2682933.1 PH domain-containing protein [Siccirubricoccus soli]